MYNLKIKLLFTGVFLISKPQFLFGEITNRVEHEDSMDRVIGISAALVGAVLIALTVILIRHLSHLHPALTTYYFSFWGLFITSGKFKIHALGLFFKVYNF